MNRMRAMLEFQGMRRLSAASSALHTSPKCSPVAELQCTLSAIMLVENGSCEECSRYLQESHAEHPPAFVTPASARCCSSCTEHWLAVTGGWSECQQSLTSMTPCSQTGLLIETIIDWLKIAHHEAASGSSCTSAHQLRLDNNAMTPEHGAIIWYVCS